MSVKSIFKVLIGTIFLIVFSSLIIEIFNLSVTMHQMRGAVQTALTKSCDLFAQETYKTDTSITKGAGDLSNILTAENNVYVSGDIYEGDDAGEIWQELYADTDSSFRTFLNSVKDGNNYKWASLELLDMAINKAYVTTLNNVELHGLGANPSEAEILNYNKSAFAKAYADGFYTPLNLGITYLNQETVEKIFRWNLTKLLTNGYKERIVKDESGKYYVKYSGFRCYANEAKIKSITYDVYNLADVAQKSKFAALTGIGSTNAINKGSLGFSDDEQFIKETMGIDIDERQIICLASIEYSMPVAYEGVTPIKSIFEFAFNQEVKGMDGAAPNIANQTYRYNTESMTGGKASSNVTTPTSGHIYYYIVR